MFKNKSGGGWFHWNNISGIFGEGFQKTLFSTDFKHSTEDVQTAKSKTIQIKIFFGQVELDSSPSF